MDDFRFVHEPLSEGGLPTPAFFIGRDDDLADLCTRLQYSEGGAFLVTGYRGVGKTSFVNQVVARLRRSLAGVRGAPELIDMQLNLARSIAPVELMHYMVRSLRQRLIETGTLARLEPSLASEVELAFLRTSFSVAYKSSASSERSLSVDLKAQLPALGLGPSMGMTAKRTNQLARDLSCLSYDEKTAEYDLIQLSRRLRAGYRKRAWPWRPPGRVGLKLLFVFDELDKLETAVASDGSAPGIDTIFSALKNLFTASGISFIFIAGKDLQERWLEDVGRGDSIYESIFTYVKYLPTLDSGDLVCDAFLAAEGEKSPDAVETYRLFKQYLAFRGRGIPRRILRGFNEYVSWKSGAAALEFSKEDLRRFRFFAGLLEHLRENEEWLAELSDGEGPSGLADQRRLGLYYLTDWILGRGRTEFSFEEGVLASRQLSRLIAPGEGVAPGVVNRLLKTLVAGEYLQEISRPLALLEPGASSPESVTRYRVATRRLAEMGHKARHLEQEAEAVLAQVEARPQMAGRYQLGRVVGRGAMSVVYDATDSRTGRRVAVKVLDRALLADPEHVRRFRREVEVLKSLQHPNIVRVQDQAISEAAAFIVMEFVEGVSLGELEQQSWPLALDVSLTIGRELVLAVEHMHTRGVLWRDAKPSNIMITPEGRVVVIDFGISTLLDGSTEITRPGMIVGTLNYMSPEQVTGRAIDARSDLFALGTVLYEMVTGTLPFNGRSPVESLSQICSDKPLAPSNLQPLPAEIDALILRCLAKEPEDRFQSAREFLEAIPLPLGPVSLGALVQSVSEYAKLQAQKEDDVTREEFPAMGSAARLPKEIELEVSERNINAPVLVVTRPIEASFVLTAPRYRLGRSPDCEIVLEDPGVSRYHAELIQSERGYLIQDLNAVNGLFIDGQLADRADLADGSVITFGATCEMHYLAPSPAAENRTTSTVTRVRPSSHFRDAPVMQTPPSEIRETR